MRTILVLATVAACGGRAPSPAAPPHNAAPAGGPPVQVVSLRRTACMGRCPVYEVAISDDGSVTWKGEDNVAVIGLRTAKIDAAKVQALVDAFVAARYMELDDDGKPPRDATCRKNPDGSETCEMAGAVGCSDTPHAQLTFTHDGKTHATDDAHCEDNALVKLEDLVDATAGTSAWRGGGDAP